MKDVLLTSSVLIGALLILRLLFRRVIARRVQYALWLLVAVRLLVPVSLPAADFSVLTAAEPVSRQITAPSLYMEPVQEDVEGPADLPALDKTPSDYSQVAIGGATKDNTRVFTDEKNVTHTVEYARQIHLTDILAPAWYAGIAVMLFWMLVSNLRFWQMLRRKRVPYEVQDCLYPVYLVKEGLSSPCLFGLVSPAIYLTPAAVAESCEALVKAIKNSQIVMLPGGFSGGDEPDGSAKFITAFFRAPAVTEAVHELLKQRDGLMLGICNGFQALVKLGLVPYGEIRDMDANCPTLTFNTLGRHQSKLVHTRVASNKSPWLCSCEPGDEYLVAISHGEGRFVAPQNVLDQLTANGQVATQYTDLNGQPTMDLSYNPNGSLLAIEGITSPDGRVLGKMGHTERRGHDLYKNVPGDTSMPLFENGVKYFTR